MPRHSFADDHRYAARSGGWLRRGLAIGGVLAAIAAAVFFYCVSRVDRELKRYVEDRFNEHYAPMNLAVSVGSARLVEGEGVDIRDLVIYDIDRGGEAPIVVVEQLFVVNHAHLQDLVAYVPTPTLLRVRGMKLRATRQPDGTWDAMRLFPPPEFGDRMAPMTIENGTLEIDDGASGEERVPSAGLLILRDVRLSIEPDYFTDQSAGAPVKPRSTNAAPVQASNEASPERALPIHLAPIHAPPNHSGEARDDASQAALHIRGECSNQFFANMEVDGFYDTASGEWIAAGAAERLEWSGEFRDKLPREVADPLAALAGLRCEATLQFRFAGKQPTSTSSAAASTIEFKIWGDVRRGVLEDERLPRALTDLSCKVYCDNRGLAVEKFAARFGGAEITGAGQKRGWEANAPATIVGYAAQLALDDLSLYEAMPAALRGRCSELDLAGLVDADMRLDFDGTEWSPSVTVECRDVSFSHREFPHRLTGAVGSLSLDAGVLDVALTAQSDGRPVRIEARIENPGPEYTGWMEIDCERPAPISSSLVDALPQATQDVVRSLHLMGEASVWARIERDDPRQTTPHWRLRIGLHECSVKYARFAFPLSRINGVLEARDGAWKFRDLSGYNGGAYVTCQGGWAPGNPREPLWFDFVATDVPLDEELRKALSPGGQKLWSSMRPRGTIDEVRIGLEYFAKEDRLSLDVLAEKRPSEQNIEGRSLSIEPQWLPYRLDDITGAVHYRDGVIELRGFQGWHGRTSVATKGELQILPDGGWSADFREMVAERLYADHDLISALPVGMSKAVARLQLTGPARVFGALSVSKGGEADSPLAADWDITVDAVGAGMEVSVPIESIQGGVRLVGKLDGDGLRCRGELGVDSLMINGLQVTEVAGPVWIDESNVLLGAWAEPAKATEPARRLMGKLLGGTLAIDAQVMLNSEKDFQVHADFQHGDLATIAQELAPRQRQITGKAYASVKLSGSQKGRHTWRGTGQVRLREANIYQLPVMVSLLKVLSARDPDGTAFTTSDIDFHIGDERAYLDKIDFQGDAITLKGRGEIDLAGRLNVNFYTLLGRDEFWAPVVTHLWGEASQQVLLIHARGTLQAPEVTKEAFPGVNQTLANMFPELAKRPPNK